MLILLLFAFLAGVFTVLSPCILPILPAILSAGTLQGRWRPLGIIVGLIASFTFFTLSLNALVHALGISPNILRYAAIVLIFAFGVIMIFPKLSNWFARITAPLANVKLNVGSGFWGGFVFGIALGLLWTPCAGPILAAITTLVATSEVNATAVFLTLAYSIGAGLPMFLIAYGGGKIIQSSRFLSAHAEGIRQFFGVMMIAVAIALTFHWEMLLQQKLMRFLPSTVIEDNTRVQQELDKLKPIPASDALENRGKAPELVGITGWINSPPLTLQELRGKVVLIDFWTYSCINCLRTLPYLEKWDKDYRSKGLVIIGVNTPEFAFEKDYDNVASAVKRLGVKYPVALDNDYMTWQAYHNNYWPAHYLIDQQGNLRAQHFGEGGYVETENQIRMLLGMSTLSMQEPEASERRLTPETYLGIARGHSYVSEIKLGSDRIYYYKYYVPLSNDEVGIRGPWKAEQEYVESAGDDSFLDLSFQASRVYLVLGGESRHEVEVYLDGNLVKSFMMDGDRKYDIVLTGYGRHKLSLKVPPGIRAYAFTFGDE